MYRISVRWISKADHIKEVMSIFKEITDEFVKNVLRTHKERLFQIHKRILELYEEMQNTDALIRSMSTSSKLGKIGGGKTGNQDLGDFLIRHHKLLKQQSEELRAELFKLSEEEETINRVWSCFRALTGQEQEYLQSLYVEGKTYKETELESGVSHRTFEITRRNGIKRILKMYQSSWNNREILAGYKKTKSGCSTVKREKQESSCAGYEQLTLNL